MAGEGDLLKKLTALVASYDDAAWEAIASKGLLRRARKDMEKGPAAKVLGEEAQSLKVEVAPFIVNIPEAGPAKATCTCPSPGICQHIIVAGLYLQQQIVENGSSVEPTTVTVCSYESAAQELMNFQAGELQKWAGIAAFRQAVVIASSQGDVSITQSVPVIIKLPSLNVECRYMAGAGLDGIIVSGGVGRELGKHAVAAILLFQFQSGKPLPEEFLAEAATAESSGAPRTRDEILSSVEQILELALEVGLSHVSASTKDRLTTLSISAQGANLPRLALLLRSVADEAGLIVERNAQADEARLLLVASHLYALAQAIRNSKNAPRADLIGQTRSRYHELASLELNGIAAYPWLTRSGYRGLTVLFWDNRNRQLFSWSQARPESQSFDPVSCYKGEGPWQGTQSPEQISRSQIKLMNLRKNSKGRLSSSSQTRAIVTGPAGVGTLDFGDRHFTQWSALHTYAEKISPLGLRESNALDEIVVVQAARWSAPDYNEIEQMLHWSLVDSNEATLDVTIPHDDYGAAAIRYLENFELPESGSWKLVGKIVRKASGLSLHPITILQTAREERILHLALEQSGPTGVNMILNAGDSFEEDDGDTDRENGGEVEISEIPLERKIAAVLRNLELIAEAGTEAINPLRISDLASLAKDLDGSGLPTLGRACHAFTGDFETKSSKLYYLRYLCELHQQAGLKALSAANL